MQTRKSTRCVLLYFDFAIDCQRTKLEIRHKKCHIDLQMRQTGKQWRQTQTNCGYEYTQCRLVGKQAGRWGKDS